MEELSGAAARWVKVAAFYPLCLLTLVDGAFIERGLNAMAVCNFVGNGIVRQSSFLSLGRTNQWSCCCYSDVMYSITISE